MMCLAVIDSNSEHRNIIRNWIIKYTVQQNCEIETLWIIDQDPIEKIAKYAVRFQMVLINLDLNIGEECGRVLYENNPDCRILYYSERDYALYPVLSTRPIGYMFWNDGEKEFIQKFDEIYKEVMFSISSFRYETRSTIHLFFKRNILYFQSDLRYVNICLIKGESPRILAKLSDIEKHAGEGFIRIHKSFVVNIKHVIGVDKKNHSVLMSNREILPISDSQYEEVCETLRYIIKF